MVKKQDLIIGGVILAVVLVFILLVVILFRFGREGEEFEIPSGDKVALVELTGIIYDSRNMVSQIKKYRETGSVKAIVLRINSPGGGIAAVQEIYEEVKETRDSGKPVVVSMASVAASGGYYVALGADTIMANPGTTTGSIGVIAEIPNVKGLFEKIGVKFEVIKSGKFKDTGSPHRALTEEEKKYLKRWVDDAFGQFKAVVAQERHLTADQLDRYSDGRIFTGRQAVEFGLIDLLGTYEDAIELAAKMGGIEGKPKIIKKKKKRLSFFDILFGDVEAVLSRIQEKMPGIEYRMW